MSPIATRNLTPAAILYYVFGTLVLLAMLSYVLFQARFLIGGPQVALEEELSMVQSERQITLRGVAANITAITLNGRSIETNQAGYFEETVILENGYTIVSIEAADRYGRTTKVERAFVYTPLTLLPS